MVSCARWMFSSSKHVGLVGFVNEKIRESKVILISCLFLVLHLRNTGLKITYRIALMQKGTMTLHKTVTRLILPSPPNPSENAGYLLLSSPSFDFPALPASYSSTVCTVQSCWVKEKIAQVIRKQTNKNRLLFLSLPSSSNKATSRTVNHTAAIICPYQKPRTCYFFCCACRQEKNVSLRVSHHKVLAESIIYLCNAGYLKISVSGLQIFGGGNIN